MADCPLCEDWRYDGNAEAVCAWLPGDRTAPVVWDGERLRQAAGNEPPGGRPPAIGAHMCFDHSDAPQVLLLGPVEAWNPIKEFSRVVNAWLDSKPWWRPAVGV